MQIDINERSKGRREDLSEPVLNCPCDPECSEEVCTTLNVSRGGLYFATTSGHYFPGMNVIVTPNFRPDDSMQREYFGDVVEGRAWRASMRDV